MADWQFQTIQDSILAMLGADNNNNTQATTNVVANADGSIVERLEFMQAGQSGTAGIASWPAAAAPANGVSIAEAIRYIVETQLPGVERTIVKTDGAVLNGDDDLFVVAGGPIMITQFVGRVTTILSGSANLTIQEAVTTPSGDVAFSTTVAVDNDAAGTTYTFTAASPSVLTPTTAGALVNVPSVKWLAVPGTIQALGSAAATGVIEWSMSYIPLSPSATVTAAA